MEPEERIQQPIVKTTAAGVDQVHCVICLDTVSERACTLPCRHSSFDFLCLISWLHEHPTCPLCKTAVDAVEYDGQQGHLGVSQSAIYEIPRPSLLPPPSAPPNRNLLHPETLNPNPERQPISLPPQRHDHERTHPAHHQLTNPTAALLRRKHIYAHGLYSLHIGSNRLSRFRDLTPRQFARDPECISRARKWIRRELQVFPFLTGDGDGGGGGDDGGSNSPRNKLKRSTTTTTTSPEFLLEYIIALLKTVEIKGSGGHAEDTLQEFLGRRHARLFLHELRAWLRSPFAQLADWDRWVQYPELDTATAAWGEERREGGGNGRGTLEGRAMERKGNRHRPYGRQGRRPPLCDRETRVMARD